MPRIHGRTYAELDDWRLPNRELRIFVELTAMENGGRQHLFDLDALRVFLDAQKAPCSVTLITSGPIIDVRREFAGLTAPVTIVPDFVSAEVVQEVASALVAQRSTIGSSYMAISVACQAKVDIVIPQTVPTEPSGLSLQRQLKLSVSDWHSAKRECEVFCCGHDVPWSFKTNTWGIPYQGLYTFGEFPEPVRNLHAAAVANALSADTVELIRSLALNRHPALAFTRDRLLYYVQQMYFARRHNLRRSEPSFELDYYLNHYYVLLWAGLDQVCWILNGVLGLGIADHEHRKIGAGKDVFLKLVEARSREIHAVFTDATFVTWRKVVAGARHHAAHRGITLASTLYLTDGEDVPVEVIDAAIAVDLEWMDLQATLGKSAAEQYRDQFRFKERLRRLEKAPHRMMRVTIDKRPALIAPLLNIQHDFDVFTEFMNKVARLATEYLASPPTRAAAAPAVDGE